jgi:hypothetical protein
MTNARYIRPPRPGWKIRSAKTIKCSAEVLLHGSTGDKIQRAKLEVTYSRLQRSWFPDNLSSITHYCAYKLLILRFACGSRFDFFEITSDDDQ